MVNTVHVQALLKDQYCRVTDTPAFVWRNERTLKQWHKQGEKLDLMIACQCTPMRWKQVKVSGICKSCWGITFSHSVPEDIEDSHSHRVYRRTLRNHILTESAGSHSRVKEQSLTHSVAKLFFVVLYPQWNYLDHSSYPFHDNIEIDQLDHSIDPFRSTSLTSVLTLSRSEWWRLTA